MKEQLEKALWERVKSTYPSGTSKHTNALLEEDFNDFIEQVVKLCTIHHVVGRSEQLKPKQKCYKSGEPCEYGCSGLCKESC